MIKAVLFDLDGTLLDTSEGIKHSVAFAIQALGYQPLPNEVVLQFVGPPIQNSLITHLGVSVEEAQKGANIFRDYYKSEALFEAALYPDILLMLSKLKDNGIKIGVATYKREDYAIDLLKHFGIADYCDVIHGADNENKLTKADIIEICIRELREKKDDIILVGDTEHDAKGANDAGIGFIAVTWGFGFKSNCDVTQYPCLAIINNVLELKGFILR